MAAFRGLYEGGFWLLRRFCATGNSKDGMMAEQQAALNAHHASLTRSPCY
ncbi:MAG TPA: hypothetical protein VMD30_07970 [Tepidisphaeraceae bacterium]|nr:hypothetical protein [Tepidisphaeraceae bacterium]